MKTAGSAMVLVSLLSCTVSCFGALGAKDSGERSIGATAQEQAENLKTYVGAALAANQVARIYFNGACNAQGGHPMLLPELKVAIPPVGHGLATVQAMFGNNSNVVVSEAHPGIVTIRIGEVSGAILDTKLPKVSLTQDAQYNPGGPGNAIDTIEKTSEFKAAAQRLRIHQVSVFHDSLQWPADGSLPHLPPTINDTTVDQSLDMVAKTFRGIVVYGECKTSDGEGLIDIEFIRFPNN